MLDEAFVAYFHIHFLEMRKIMNPRNSRHKCRSHIASPTDFLLLLAVIILDEGTISLLRKSSGPQTTFSVSENRLLKEIDSNKKKIHTPAQ
jgi:hypothetical protein